MNNPWYNSVNGGSSAQQPRPSQQPAAMNPFQKMQRVMQAMQNPLNAVRQLYPDVPANMTDPNQIMRYVMQSRGVTDQDLQNVAGQIPQMPQR